MSGLGPLRFPKSARVRTRADYACAFDGARRLEHPLLSLASKPGGAPARLGLAVSRKVSVRAVVRNRIKRQWRETFRLVRATLPAGSYVAIARPAAAQADATAWREALATLLARAAKLPPRALPPHGSAGTIAPAGRAPARVPSPTIRRVPRRGPPSA